MWNEARERTVGRQSRPVIEIFYVDDFENTNDLILRNAGKLRSLIETQTLTTLSFQLVDCEFRQLEFTVATNVQFILRLEMI